MAMVRMFTCSCDICLEYSDYSEWYSATAKEQAILHGWYITGTKMLCPKCKVNA